MDGTIIFNQTTKYVEGNYKSRIEAERNLIDIKKMYPNVHLIRPTKHYILICFKTEQIAGFDF
jgi:hypothetical protein